MKFGWVALPVSLEHLATGHPFSVFECFRSILNIHWDPRIFSDELETNTLRVLTLFGNGPNDAKLLLAMRFSMWILVANQCRENLKYLKDTFKRRRFVALERPGMSTYLPLIDLRQQIVGMRDYLPPAQAANDSLGKLVESFELPLRPSNLSEILAQTSDDLKKLDKELNDEIHLIIGAVTVQDSDANKTQTERATLLTILAAVYLPLTLVTGIFGMNIKDISDGSPTWRHCGEVLAVTAACTIVFVLAYRQWRVWRRAQQEKERSEFAFDKEV
jgi:hypothetical protein